MSEALGTVVTVMREAGYELLPKPLTIAGTVFDFHATLTGTGVSHDLVVVADAKASPPRLLRMVSALSRTLDHIQSKRPVSVVLVGEVLDHGQLAELERYARVLPIEGEQADVEKVRRAVAVLLPLTLPSATGRGGDPLALVAQMLGPAVSSEQWALIDAASRGPEQVRTILRGFIDSALVVNQEGDAS